MDECGEDLAARVAAAQEPLPRCAPPPAPLRVRIGTSQPLRRLLPTRIAVARARRRGARAWDRAPAERDRARAAMAAVLAGTPRAHEVEALARAHVIEGHVKETLYWQSWRVAPLDAASAGHLRAALASGRGVLVSTCHTGPYNLALGPVADAGATVYSASGWGLDDVVPGYWGRRIAVRRNRAAARGERLVRAAGSYPLLAALLERGEVVSVFFSMPGSFETPFLGKPVMLASGSARLATQADALVLPLRARVDGHRVRVDAGGALDPRRHDDVEGLHMALAAHHERWLLQAPEAMEDPNRAGAWEGAAGPAGWPLPPGRGRGASPRSAPQSLVG